MVTTLFAPWDEGAEAGAGAMLVVCRLAGLSALEMHYADVNLRAQSVVTGRAEPVSALSAAAPPGLSAGNDRVPVYFASPRGETI
jgi:hypothetical protein